MRYQLRYCPTYKILVLETGLEPARPKALVPKTSVSTNSTIPAHYELFSKTSKFIGTGDRTRTDTGKNPRDFKSLTATYYVTPARDVLKLKL